MPPLEVAITRRSGRAAPACVSASRNAIVTMRALRCSRPLLRERGTASDNQASSTWPAVLQRVFETSKSVTSETASLAARSAPSASRASGPSGLTTPAPVTNTLRLRFTAVVRSDNLTAFFCYMIASEVANSILVLQDLFSGTAAPRRLSEREALLLFQSDDLDALSSLATRERDRRHGDRAFYIVNRHINYSNICILECAFCAFGKRRRDADAYELTVDEIAGRAAAAHAHGALEIHMVGGLHPTWKFEAYLETLQTIRAAAPHATIKAFTAVEILHLSWIGKRSLEGTLSELREAGLDCLTGGGAEIFAPLIRKTICRGKESAEEWLHIHRTAHELGIRSTATMLFGHLESY